MLATLTASAQKGEMAVGGSLNFGILTGRTDIGLMGKYQYNILDQLRAEASVGYYFKKDYVTQLEANVNLHYLFNLGQGGWKIYPLAGLAWYQQSWDYPTGYGYGIIEESDSKSWFGLNLGVGVEYPITEKLKIAGEFRHQILDGSREVISLGVNYTF